MHLEDCIKNLKTAKLILLKKERFFMKHLVVKLNSEACDQMDY